MKKLGIVKNLLKGIKTSFRNCGMSIMLIFSIVTIQSAHAQVSIAVNIISQPLWGPVSYNYVEYYYLPEAHVYYYVPTSKFIYLEGGTWMMLSYLPARYHIDLYRTYKVVINEPRPYLRHNVYYTKYAKYKTVKSKQGSIRDSHDKKYYVVKGHPNHANSNNAKPKSEKSKPSQPKSSKPANSGSVKPSHPKGNNSKGSESKANGKKNK